MSARTGRNLALAALLAYAGPASAFTTPLTNQVEYRNFFGGMTFSRPLALVPYPGTDSAYIVVEQVGKLRTVEWKNGAWAKTDSAVFQVPVIQNTGDGKCAVAQPRTTASGIVVGNIYESRGLLGFAFHPRFGETRKYYVSYIAARTENEATYEFTYVDERVADSTLRPKTADSARTLFRFCQPGWDHKGGHIEFGPDSMLYYTSGDGGNQGQWNSMDNPARKKDSWLGKVIRIDVDGPPDSGKAYRVPPDNPFVDSAGFLPEIWAWGVRNPWKWHFHPVTGKMWLGNVGYTNRDNIYRVTKGADLGWPVWEGNHCSANQALRALCPTTPYLAPAIDLQHNSDARSVTGGTFFIGDTLAPFHGAYFFGDYIYNWVRVARFDPETDTLLEYRDLNDIPNVVSFDRDNRGRILATSLGTGNVGNNTGEVFLLESPGFSVPVGIARPPAPRPGARPLAYVEFLRHRERYDVTGLDGKRLTREPASGTVAVREKATGTVRLMTIAH